MEFIHIHNYKIKLVMFMIIQIFRNKLDLYSISFNNSNLCYIDENQKYTIIHVNHNHKKKYIKKDEIFNSFGIYSIFKYIIMYKKYKNELSEKNIKNLIIFTNDCLKTETFFINGLYCGLLFYHMDSVVNNFDQYILNKDFVDQILLCRDNFLENHQSISIHDTHNLQNISRNDIIECSEKIIFIVNQPNNNKFDYIIKYQLKFICHQVDLLYNDLYVRVSKWLDQKICIFPEINNSIMQPQLKYTYITSFFNKYMKFIEYNVETSIEMYIDRLEINDIRFSLEQNNEIQIYGLGGIGKTQLVRKYISISKLNPLTSE